MARRFSNSVISLLVAAATGYALLHVAAAEAALRPVGPENTQIVVAV